MQANSDREQSFFISQMLIVAGVLVVVIFIIWARWAEVDQITRATGQVITSSRNQVIQTIEGGVISHLPVKEGSTVKAGDPLVEFDQTRAEAAYLESRAKVAALIATIARLKTELYGGKLEFPAELDDYKEFKDNQKVLFEKRQKTFREELSALREMQKLIEEEMEMNLPLLETGDIGKADILRFKRQMVDIRKQVSTTENTYLKDTQTELAAAEEELASAKQIMAQRKDQLGTTEIISPMDGVVRNVRITTIGGVAKPGEEIMQIVPVDEDLVIEAKIRPADIAFIHVGLPAVVKFDAYDYTIYGSLKGEVTYVSVDTLTEDVRGEEQFYYRVHVRITDTEFSAKKDNQTLNIQPGMTTTVEIQTGKKTVFQYLTKPITKTLNESLGER